MYMMFICLDFMMSCILFSASTGSFGNVSASPISVFFLFRIKVERDGWDEARLRALCARHGWEFEWMTDAWLNHSDSGKNLLDHRDLNGFALVAGRPQTEQVLGACCMRLTSVESSFNCLDLVS